MDAQGPPPLVAPVPARLRAAQSALADRPRASERAAADARRPAVLPDRWRQDRGLPRASPPTPSRSAGCRAWSARARTPATAATASPCSCATRCACSPRSSSSGRRRWSARPRCCAASDGEPGATTPLPDRAVGRRRRSRRTGTPEAAEQINEAREAGHGRRANVLQTLACPWCGADARWRTATCTPTTDCAASSSTAPRPKGADACPFSRTAGAGEGLPILTVDEEIYRYAAEPGHRHRRQARPAALARLRRHAVRRGSASAARGTATGTTTSTRGPAAATGTTRRPAWPAVTSQPGGPAAPAGPDHPGRAAPDLRRAGHHGGAVRVGRRRAVHLASAGRHAGRARRSSPPPRPRSGPREQVRRLFGRDLAVFPPQVLDVADTFFSAQVPVTRGEPGPPLPRHLRARRTAQVGRDPPRGDPAARRADPVRQVRRAGRPVHDGRRLLQRHPRAGRHAPLPRRRRHHPGPPARPTQGPVRPVRPVRPDAHSRRAHLAHLLGRHQRACSSSWRSASTPSSTPRHATAIADD